MPRQTISVTRSGAQGADRQAVPLSAPAREPIHVVRLPADILDKVERLRRIREREDDLIEDILVAVSGSAPRRPEMSADRSPRPRNRSSASAEPRVTVSWIKSVVATERADGSLIVQIDGCRLVLQPYLGALFLALAADSGLSPDEGVAFKSLDDVATRVAKRTGGPPPCNTTVNKYIHRLRQILVQRAGLTSDAIQTSRRFGRRLAIRRPEESARVPPAEAPGTRDVDGQRLPGKQHQANSGLLP